jgi:hypothetical protein
MGQKQYRQELAWSCIGGTADSVILKAVACICPRVTSRRKREKVAEAQVGCESGKASTVQIFQGGYMINDTEGLHENSKESSGTICSGVIRQREKD